MDDVAVDVDFTKVVFNNDNFSRGFALRCGFPRAKETREDGDRDPVVFDDNGIVSLFLFL